MRTLHPSLICNFCKPEADIEFSRREFDKYLSAGHSHRQSPKDLFAAFFALDRYLKQRPDDASALHLFSLVCERIGHVELAIERTDRAISLLEAAYEETEDPVIERQFTIANATAARLRLAMRDYEGALSSFQTALGLLPEEGEDRALKTQCLFGSGLASFKLGALEDAIENFEAALVAAGDDLHMRGHVTVLLAQTLWATGTAEGREMAQSQLLNWCASEGFPFFLFIRHWGMLIKKNPKVSRRTRRTCPRSTRSLAWAS